MHPIFVITLGWVWLWTSAISSGTSPQARRHDPNTPEAIPIVVSPDGFLKQTLSLPEGAYVFVVLNRTGFRDITVYLERMPGNTGTPSQREFGDTVGASRARLVKNAKLTPGTYRLRVEGRPSWVCAIQVK